MTGLDIVLIAALSGIVGWFCRGLRLNSTEPENHDTDEVYPFDAESIKESRRHHPVHAGHENCAVCHDIAEREYARRFS